MISSVWMWWQGYITVRLRGPGLERLLNKMADLNILMQRVERLTGDVMIVRMRIKDFRRLRPLLPGSQINVSILDKHGAPFLFGRLKLRAFLGLGLLLSILFIVYLSNFIWFIQVHGSEKLPLEALKVATEDLGLRMGVAKNAIAPREIEAELLKRFSALSWVRVRVKGVRVEISLVDRDGLDVEYGGAGHIYSQRDGVITEILVLRGTPQVGDGDTVRKDDLLISGVYNDARGKQFGAAQGVIKARVWYEGVGEAALTRWEPIKTGKIHRQYALTLGSMTIPIGRSYSRETHLIESEEWQVSLGKAMVPISLRKIDYQEVTYARVAVSRQEAEKTAHGLAWESLTQQGVQEENVVEEKLKVDLLIDGDGLRVTVQVEVLEDIGQFLSQ